MTTDSPAGLKGDQDALRYRNATLMGGISIVAGAGFEPATFGL